MSSLNMYYYNKKLVQNARVLRKNMTPEERKIWFDFFKKLPFTVKRQHNIGNYIVDFYIAKYKTVIEIDGLQHGDEEHLQTDKVRDLYLSKLGIKVLRYTNKDINKNLNSVARDILNNFNLEFSDLVHKD